MRKILLVVALFLFVGTLSAVAAEVPRMSKDDLKAELDSATVAVLDARSGKDWKSSEFKIKGAIRTPGKKIDDWLESVPKDKKLVIYCA